jgi:hypothetical protein
VAYEIVDVDELPELLAPLVDPVPAPVLVLPPLPVPIGDVPVPPVVPPPLVPPVGLLAPLPPPEPDDVAVEPPEPPPPPPHEANTETIKAIISHAHTLAPTLGPDAPVVGLRIIASFFPHRARRAPRRVAE